jgi:hypothetical protein
MKLNHMGSVALVAVLSLLNLTSRATSGEEPAKSIPTPPPTPQIVAIQVEPAALTLADRRDARRVLVTGVTENGFRFDLTGQATFQPAADIIQVDSAGYFNPSRDGQTTVRVRAAGHQAEIPVTVRTLEPIQPASFVRDVMPIFSKIGCNAGTCHGAAKGRNGFKLSLRGYDPEFDHHALVDELSGRRFNRAEPAQSLMLLKPSGGVPHQGGVHFEPGSRYYELMKQWIAEGVKSDVATTSRAERLEVIPSTINLDLPGRTQQVLVLAHYTDGSSRDVTRDAICSSSVPEVAAVSGDGMVTAVRRGEAALLVRYEGVYATNGILVMGDRSGFHWQTIPENNYIDTFVYQKLNRIKVLPSYLCTDEEFIRRLYLDLTGQVPPPEKVRAFLADEADSRAKRERLIDELIGSPAFVDHWTHKWCDLLQVNRKFLGVKGMWAFHGWVRQAVARNQPYDQFVRELLTASGNTSDHTSAAANFLRVNREPNIAAENTTQLFLGTRFNCCQCHDHPFERWTQRQYYGLTAYFATVGVKKGQSEGEEIVFERRDGKEVLHPKSGTAVAPSVPYSHGVPIPADVSRREALAAWLIAPENPLFARSMVNRTWSYLLGRGIIDPVDDIRSSNPASNPELLDALTDDFIEHKFDVQHLLRTICRSRVYQHSFRTNQWNADDVINFSHALPRRLTAEQLLDSVIVATGSTAGFPGLPRGFRAAQLPDSNIGVASFLDQFGRPARESSCECERSSEVSLAQAMTMINGPTVATALADPKGRIAQLMQSNADDKKLVEELYLAAWGRFPTAAEMNKAIQYLASSPSKQEGAQDLLWALLNSPAFLFNR